MKKYITLFAGPDNKSYFKEETPDYDNNQPLGIYSKKRQVKGMMFRMVKEGEIYDWHTAPQPQFIVYLEGEV